MFWHATSKYVASKGRARGKIRNFVAQPPSKLYYHLPYISSGPPRLLATSAYLTPTITYPKPSVTMPTRDPSLPPLKVFIFLAPDCSGSTAFGDFLRSMHEDNHPNRSFLNNHKYDAEDDEGWVDGMILNQEWLKEKKKTFKTKSNT